MMGQRQASQPALMMNGQPQQQQPPQQMPRQPRVSNGEDQGYYQNIGTTHLQQPMPLRYNNGPIPGKHLNNFFKCQRFTNRNFLTKDNVI